MQSAPRSSQASPAPLHAAFREVHGPTLHGFALLLTLGDQTRAVRAATEALTDASSRLGELRHPERAAAWLRFRVVHNLNRRRRGPEPRRSDRLAVLNQLDVSEAVRAGLAALGLRERAALVATNIERLGTADVAVIVGRSEDRLHGLLVRARASYLRAYIAAADGTQPAGPTIDRVRDIAARAMT